LLTPVSLQSCPFFYSLQDTVSAGLYKGKPYKRYVLQGGICLGTIPVYPLKEHPHVCPGRQLPVNPGVLACQVFADTSVNKENEVLELLIQFYELGMVDAAFGVPGPFWGLKIDKPFETSSSSCTALR